MEEHRAWPGTRAVADVTATLGRGQSNKRTERDARSAVPVDGTDNGINSPTS